LTTTAGDLRLRISKLRTGSFFPSLLERRWVDQALFAVVMEAYLHGVSTAQWMTWSKRWVRTPASARARCRGSTPTWTSRSAQFPDRSLAEHAFPYVFLDATYCTARVNRRMVSQAVVIATGVRADGWREVLGFAVGASAVGTVRTACSGPRSSAP